MVNNKHSAFISNADKHVDFSFRVNGDSDGKKSRFYKNG